MTESADPRVLITRRLTEASEALAVAEADAYRSSVLAAGVRMRVDHLTELADRARADATTARASAERCEVDLLAYEGELAWYLPQDVEERREFNVRSRAGIEPRYTETGVRLANWPDDWGLNRANRRVARARAAAEAERRHAEALTDVALRLEASAHALAKELERGWEEHQRLVEVVQVAQERYDAIKAEAAALGAAEPSAD